MSRSRNIAILLFVAIFSVAVTWVISHSTVSDYVVDGIRADQTEALFVGLADHISVLEQWQLDVAPVERERVIELLRGRILQVYRGVEDCVSTLSDDNAEILARAITLLKNWYKFSGDEDNLKVITTLEKRIQC